MGAFRRHVAFTAPAYSRLPRDDEACVMKVFARHASHCPSCANPYEVHRSGGTLCPKGRQRALDVAQYFYSRAGKTYSLFDHEGNQSVQIEIPPNCEAVRSLLRAMERGPHILKRTPTVSYDRNYYVPARPVTTYREPSYLRKPRLETAEPPAWAAVKRPRVESVNYRGRGSSYEAEMRDRARYYKPTVYYRVASQGPPVPPKDYYW